MRIVFSCPEPEGLAHRKAKKRKKKEKRKNFHQLSKWELTNYVPYVRYVSFIFFGKPPPPFPAGGLDFFSRVASLQDGLVVAVGVGVAGLVSEEGVSKLLIRTGPSMTGIYGAAGPCHGRGLPLRHLIGGPPAATIAFSTQS